MEWHEKIKNYVGEEWTPEAVFKVFCNDDLKELHLDILKDMKKYIETVIKEQEFKLSGKCKHEWRVNPYAFQEQCIGAVCIKCGERGCGCDARKDNGGTLPENFYNDEGREYINREQELKKNKVKRNNKK